MTRVLHGGRRRAWPPRALVAAVAAGAAAGVILGWVGEAVAGWVA